MVRTVKLILKTPPEVLLPTVEAFTKAYNYVCKVGFKDKDRNGVSLHHKTYYKCRKYLTADLTCSARAKAIESLKSVHTHQIEELKKAKHEERKPEILSCPESKQESIRYNDKTYTISFEKSIVSLQTLDGRIKIPFEMCEYFKKYLTWERRSAELFVRDGIVYLHISFRKSADEVVSNNKIVGVDRGIKKLAVTSDNRFFGGGHVKQVSDRYQKLRSVLQSKGHSGKRHFLQIKRKENRFRSDVNHCISKKIISTLQPGTTLVLEDLTGIRERTIHKRRKKNRREHSSWSYFQLEFFLKYKAEAKGVIFAHVDARYTSQRCSKCGHIEKGNRTKQAIFKCKHCGFQLNADLNASRNIVCKHLDAKSYQDEVSQRTLCSPPTAA